MSTGIITLNINGKQYSVGDNYDSRTKLVDFLRDEAYLTGTKFMCRAGLCGACVVTAAYYDPIAKENRSVAVNSCLLPLYTCNNMRITTIEGLGGRKAGYHSIQQRLAEYNGTQCGYCTPGMIMNMYSLLRTETVPTYKEIEDSYDGHICRCTGFRPIIEAMKTFGKPTLSDIEDLNDWVVYDACNTSCISLCNNGDAKSCNLPTTKLNDGNWYHPTTLPELKKILRDLKNSKYRYVFGNTARGVFESLEDNYNFFINIKGIQELYQYSMSSQFTIGANVSLYYLIKIFSNKAKGSQYSYCDVLADHIKGVANVAVRNVASWAGNLMLKSIHPEFPSDIFILFECVGAKLTLGSYNNAKKTVSPSELLTTPMSGWIIQNVILPPLSSQFHLITYKVKKRNENIIAYVNAAFLFQLDVNNNFKILSKPSIVYGGISSDFVHAKKTEDLLFGKELGKEETLKMALQSLSEEIIPSTDPALADAKYRKLLSLTLFYKMVLKIIKCNISQRYLSGGENIFRPLSSASQDFPTDQSEWPLTKAIPKVEALSQCSGELRYTTDYSRPKGTHYAAFVLSTVGKAIIQSVNTSEAFNMPGVVKYVDVKDIPGVNNITGSVFYSNQPEKLFPNGEVEFNGQPIGLIVADSLERAKLAAKKVKIQYSNVRPSIVTIEDGIKAGKIVPGKEFNKKQGDAEGVIAKASKKIKGEVYLGSQYHYHLETQVALSIPTKDGVKVISSAQWTAGVQAGVAQILGMKKSNVDVTSQFVGGGFGAKATQSTLTAAGSALASYVINKPVYLQLDFETNMKALGKRYPLLAKYEAAFKNDGTLEAIKLICYFDVGIDTNGVVIPFGISARTLASTYSCPNISIEFYSVITDKPNNTFCRAPGSTEGTFLTEYIMEHAAKYFGMDPVDFKQKNLIKEIQYPIKKSLQNDVSIHSYQFSDLFDQLLKSAEVTKRKGLIDQFNKENRWRKKGLSVSPIKFGIEYEKGKPCFNVLVSIFTEGGTVAITHGGVEIGQGINTKVAQVCAYELGIPLEMITVKQHSSITNPNNAGTVSSMTSETVCIAVIECCQELKRRMDPIRKKLGNPTWQELINECTKQNVDLGTRAWVGPGKYPTGYNIFSTGCSEVEIDILTGSVQVNRVDILYDAGKSMSPLIDIGQIEGCFIMGLGYYLTEEIKYNSQTGVNLSISAFDYVPPTFKDTPVDFRVNILRNAPNPTGVLSSKATGEPPLCLSATVFMAVKAAIAASRQEKGDNEWFQMNAPATPENIVLCSQISAQDFTFQDKKIMN